VTLYSRRRRQIFAFASFSAVVFGVSDRGTFGVVFGALLLGAGLFVLRRPRLSADEQGLTIVNLLRTRHVPWVDVGRLEASRSDLGLAVQLRDGRILHAWVLTPNPSSGYSFARRGEIVAELRQLHARATGSHVAGVVDAPLRDRRAGWSNRFVLAIWLVLSLFFAGLGIYLTWHSVVALPRTYAHLRSSGVPATAQLEWCGHYEGGNGLDCRLQLSYAGTTRTWEYPNDVHQFHGLPLGAPIAMLVDPAHPTIAYTVHDVDANTNAGWGIVSFFGVALVLAGAIGLFWCVQLIRRLQGLTTALM
jgi:hypothetical protein